VTPELHIKSERGLTLIELVVSMAIGTVVILAIFSLTEVSMRSSAKTAARVDADQRGRPVMQRLIDQLHSTCMGPDAGPILAGSSDTQLTFLHGTGSSVGPTPNKHVVTLTGNTLSETIYGYSSGQAPNWVFTTNPISTKQLLSGVGPGTINGSTVPLFRYYSYVDGTIDPTPLPTPLSAQNAALTVQVAVAFSSSPADTPVPDPKAAVTIADSALVRFSPASEDPTKVNGPCV
jgi:prepilin-type N-terminal cleavage/methylation domain-containing protein